MQKIPYALIQDPPDNNLFINGGFNVWQRGTSLTTGGFTADRWQVRSSASSGGWFQAISVAAGDVIAAHILYPLTSEL